MPESSRNFQISGKDRSMTADEALKLVQLNAPPRTNTVGPRGGDVTNPDKRPQYRNASFNGSIERGLHRFVQPKGSDINGLMNEQPWHRMAAYMFNAGRTTSEVAIASGMSTSEVSILKGQRWFQELCATIANDDGEEVLGALKSEALASIDKLVTLRDYAESESVQLQAARTLVEQAHGKPTQKIISDVTSRRGTSPKEEMDQLMEELAALKGKTP